jgi:hypothetical protein
VVWLLIPRDTSVGNSLGITTVESYGTAQHQETSGQEAPRYWFTKEKNTKNGSENHLGHQEKSPFPTLAVAESLVHQELSGQSRAYNTSQHKPF